MLQADMVHGKVPLTIGKLTVGTKNIKLIQFKEV
jgi:hypothetical protein